MPAWLHDCQANRDAWCMQVSLMRQMERSTRDFADWRKEREKEVMQLRRQVSLASKSHCLSVLCFHSKCCFRCCTYLLGRHDSVFGNYTTVLSVVCLVFMSLLCDVCCSVSPEV